MGTASGTDGEIVAAVLDGQRDRFAHLVLRYQQPLYRLAFQRLGDKDWAEDVVQETLLCAFKSLHSCNSRFSFRTWLWTILLNQCRRQWQRSARTASRLAMGDARPLDAQTDERAGLPIDAMLQQERDTRLREWMAMLPFLRRTDESRSPAPWQLC